MPNEREAVLAALDGLNRAFGQRDLAAWQEVSTPDFAFIGSTEGEEAIGSGEPVSAMWSAIASRSDGCRFELNWDTVDVDVIGDIALLRALGEATFTTRYRSVRTRYRLTGVLQRSGDQWLWRVHHGSEPAPW